MFLLVFVLVLATFLLYSLSRKVNISLKIKVKCFGLKAVSSKKIPIILVKNPQDDINRVSF